MEPTENLPAPAYLLPYVTPVGMDFPEHGTFEHWAGIFRAVTTYYRALPWVIGDMVVAAQARGGSFEHEAFQLIGQLGYREQSIQNMASIARQVPKAERRDDLEWGHHKAAAYLPQEVRVSLLEVAAEKGWTVREIESAVREINAKPAQEQGGDANAGRCSESEHTAPPVEPPPVDAGGGRAPDAVAKAGAAFPETEEAFEAEFWPVSQKTADQIYGLVEVLQRPTREQVAAIYQECLAARGEIDDLMNRLEMWGANAA